MLRLCFKLLFLPFGRTTDTSDIYEKAKCVNVLIYANAKSEIQICSIKHKIGLVLLVQYFIIS